MITITRDEFRKLLAGQYAVTNQSYSKDEAAKYVEAGLWTYDLMLRSFNKVDIKPSTDKLPINDESNEIVQ